MKSILGGRLREKEEEGEEEKGDKREISALPRFLVRSVAHERSFAGELPSPLGRRGEKGEGNSPCGNEATPRLPAWEQNDASPPRTGRRTRQCLVFPWRTRQQPRLLINSHLNTFGFLLTCSSGSWGIKGTTSKGASGAGSGRKPSGSRPVDPSLSSFSSPSPSVSKGRGVSVTKNSDYDSFILPFVSDTSFLEFCIKQSTSEVEMLLRENLGSMDPNHEFIDKFLNYKEFLPSDVLESAFQLQQSHNPSTGSGSHRHSNTTTATEADGAEEGLDGPSKGQGKKKGKKGQKVSASILGFNVISNRIMMGEIQSIQD
ncbi:hypothetical protein BHE74_00013682 [Ensete ventricosum]|nr:hypothetical protein BHE74_00013682 [Ensete ventricosum]